MNYKNCVMSILSILYEIILYVSDFNIVFINDIKEYFGYGLFKILDFFFK